MAFSSILDSRQGLNTNEPEFHGLLSFLEFRFCAFKETREIEVITLGAKSRLEVTYHFTFIATV